MSSLNSKLKKKVHKFTESPVLSSSSSLGLETEDTNATSFTDIKEPDNNVNLKETKQQLKKKYRK
jgi:hypothetical protein